MRAAQRQRGVSLVELLVSLAIGVILIGGALGVYINGRATYTLNETIARMQENASFALKYLERDIQLAGLWGSHNEVGAVDGRALSNPIGGLPANDCNNNWSIQLTLYMEGANNTRPAGWTCIDAAQYMPETDVLAVRRVEPTPVATAALQAGQMYLRSSLAPRGQVFIGAAEPGGFAANARNYPLIARAYYVSNDSLGGSALAPVPALRMIELVDGGAAPTLRDTEIVAGVENLQVQFGIRPTAGPTGAVAYVNADSALLAPGAGNTIVSARVWILVRSETPEAGFEDDATYTMGDVIFTPPENVRDHRRLLVTRTIDIRNRT